MANLICPHCGQVIIDVENKQIRSCSHFPISVRICGKYSEITIGTGNESFGVGTSINLAETFNKLIVHQKAGLFGREEA